MKKHRTSARGKTADTVMPKTATDENRFFRALAGSIETAILVIDGEGRIMFANTAAEGLFAMSADRLAAMRISEVIPEDSPILSLIRQARNHGAVVSEHEFMLSTLRTGNRPVALQIAPLNGFPDALVITFAEHSIALKIGQHVSNRNAGRSVAAMARLLGHEVKNPLSGIRGAAQLLGEGASTENRALTRLIIEEADRIVALVERMSMFQDQTDLNRGPVNIHEVLDRVRLTAETGFANDIRFLADYDPSLPPVLGSRDHLIQLFLNLVKNAAEALPGIGGEIRLRTAYKSGVRIAAPNGESRTQLPLRVTIEDNGAGVPEDLVNYLFEPFVTTKSKGSGLGLALVAKLVNEHSGIIEFDSQPGKTAFHVYLPVVDNPVIGSSEPVPDAKAEP